jgi:hypothetical protein
MGAARNGGVATAFYRAGEGEEDGREMVKWWPAVVLWASMGKCFRALILH